MLSIKALLAGYLGIIFIGTFLLALPPMYMTNISFLDALFTSTSAITCTGLIIKNPGYDFTIYGQIVIMILVQLGGFGHMSMAGLIYLMIGKRLTAAEKDLINVAENLNNNSLNGIGKVVLHAAIFVLIVEFIGACLLCPYFAIKTGDVIGGIWAGIFHSITAFNNAGFSIFKSGLLPYQADIFVNITISLLVIAGGLGYVTSIEITQYCYSKVRYHRIFGLKSNARLNLNARIIIVVTLILLLCGMVNVLIFEWNNAKTLANLPLWEQIVNSFFMSANYRTAGFNIFDISGFNDSTMFFSLFFMIVGGGPGGTASGIKVTTLAILIALSISIMNNRKETIIFGRSIPQDTVSRAFGIFVIAMVYFAVATFIISILEPDIRFLPLAFEVMSAFATVGLSMGDGGVLSLCAKFNDLSLSIMIFLMISGKIGILAFTLIFIGRSKTKHVHCVQEKVLI
ncbi:TrkH family potassium uptake protein [Helicobacter saguini]|nr:potassium transporter TrkG [Helicobacter saguini]